MTAEPSLRRRPLVAVLAGTVPVLSLLAAPLLIWSGPAGADDEISVTFDEIVRSPAGSVVAVQTVTVPADMVGERCTMAVEAENQSSVHIGNDLIVTTGAAQAVIVGVEDTPNGATSQSYDMVLGERIQVDMRIGRDGMSSLGFELVFDCTQPRTGPPGTPVEASTVPPSRIETGTVTSTTAPGPTLPPTVAPTSVVPAPTTTLPSSAVSISRPIGELPDGQPTGGQVVPPADLPETPTARAVTASPAYTG